MGQGGVAGEDDIDFTLLQFEQGGLEVGAVLHSGGQIGFTVRRDAWCLGRRGDIEADGEHVLHAVGHELFEEIFVVGLLAFGHEDAFLAGRDVGFGLEDVER